MIKHVLHVIRDAFYAFLDNEDLSKGAAIAFYATTSLGPVIIFVSLLAGLVVGDDMARGAIVTQFSALMGNKAGAMVHDMLTASMQHTTSLSNKILGTLSVLITSSGLFGEMQAALNRIWHVEATDKPIPRLVRARLVSIILVASMAILQFMWLSVSTLVTAVATRVDAQFGLGQFLVLASDFWISFMLMSMSLAAIYKVLPDRWLSWHDVGVGAIVTSILFGAGKSLIALYIGHANIASGYGAAGTLVVVMLWVYYSSQIFLFGAEIARAWSLTREASLSRDARPA